MYFKKYTVFLWCLISSSSFAFNYLSSYFSGLTQDVAQENVSVQPDNPKIIYSFLDKIILFDDYIGVQKEEKIIKNSGDDEEIRKEIDLLDNFLYKSFLMSDNGDNSEIQNAKELDFASSILEDPTAVPSDVQDDIELLKQSFFVDDYAVNIQKPQILSTEEKVKSETVLNDLASIFFDQKEESEGDGFSPSTTDGFIEDPFYAESPKYIYSDFSQEERDVEYKLDNELLYSDDQKSLESFTLFNTFSPQFPAAKELSISALKRISFFQTAVYDTRREAIIKGLTTTNQKLDKNSQTFFEVFTGMRGGKKHDAGMVFLKENRVYIVFKGTENFDDWKKNLNAIPVNFRINHFGGSVSGKLFEGNVHKGFLEAFLTSWVNAQKAIINVIRKADRNNLDELSFIFVGHSLGGAQAILGALALMGHTILGQPIGKNNCETNQIKLVSFGAPKVFRNDSHMQAESLLGKDNIIRFIENDDPVPKVPQIALGYSHIGIEHAFDAEDIKNRDNHFANRNINIFGFIANNVKQKLSSPLTSHSNQTYFKYVNYCFNGFIKSVPSSERYNPLNYDHSKVNHGFMLEQSVMF